MDYRILRSAQLPKLCFVHEVNLSLIDLRVVLRKLYCSCVDLRIICISFTSFINCTGNRRLCNKVLTVVIIICTHSVLTVILFRFTHL